MLCDEGAQRASATALRTGIVCWSCHPSKQKLWADDASHEPLGVNVCVLRECPDTTRPVSCLFFCFELCRHHDTCSYCAADNSAHNIFRLTAASVLLRGALLLSLKNVTMQELGCLMAFTPGDLKNLGVLSLTVMSGRVYTLRSANLCTGVLGDCCHKAPKALLWSTLHDTKFHKIWVNYDICTVRTTD